MAQVATTIDFFKVIQMDKVLIPAKSEEDEKDCLSFGVAFVSDHYLLVSDWLNTCVKLVDTTNHTTGNARVISRLPMVCRPMDITTMPENQAAVALYEENRIQVISTTNGNLTPVRSVDVDGGPQGITSTEDKFVVSVACPSKVVIMDHFGTVLNTITSDAQGVQLFKRPISVAVTNEQGQEIIYVSDGHAKTVTKVTFQGHVLSTITKECWCALGGLTSTNDGQILLCDHGSNQVHVISGNEDTFTLTDPRREINKPLAICFSREQSILCFGSDVPGSLVDAFKISQNF